MIVPGRGGTNLLLEESVAGLPSVVLVAALNEGGPSDLLAAAKAHPGSPLLVEHARGSFQRPGLRGHRLATSPGGSARDIAGRGWSTCFILTATTTTDVGVTFDATDDLAQLSLRTDVEQLVGGALRIRHTVRNLATDPYLIDGLEVCVPVPDRFTELVDFTGRHERERTPQRVTINDGLWVREGRFGKPGEGAAALVVAGQPGFDFSSGGAIGMTVATSGNSTLQVARSSSDQTTLSGGELLLPGEIVLRQGEGYSTPWVVVVAGCDGLDSLAAPLHQWQRSLPAHPSEQPATLNVWEAVYFDHDFAKLARLADLAAQIGLERFVLDDGWFHGRRHDRAGLGDWWVDEAVWPSGLAPLIEHVHSRDLQFGLWLEPEMVNPDSDLYRAHPDWVLAATNRVPLLHRHQLVLDLTNDEVWRYLAERIDALLSHHEIDYVKWDHNRDLLEAGSRQHGGSPAAHEQNLAYYRLLDLVRERHPAVDVESCAAGGGRVDLGVVTRVQRFWTSDMTDALSRQHIQRWMAQVIAPEYLGAHVSAPTSHQTGRTLSLDFRAATALFCAFGVEWDLTTANDEDLAALTGWVAAYKRWRGLLHSGRVIRLDSSDPSVVAHGVVAVDRSQALLAHVQMDESAHNRGVTLRIPQLHPDAAYRCSWIEPIRSATVSRSRPLDPRGPTGGVSVSGAALASVGLWLPRSRPETVQLIHIERVAVPR